MMYWSRLDERSYQRYATAGRFFLTRAILDLEQLGRRKHLILVRGIDEVHHVALPASPSGSRHRTRNGTHEA
jgi:hypothetical protein